MMFTCTECFCDFDLINTKIYWVLMPAFECPGCRALQKPQYLKSVLGNQYDTFDKLENKAWWMPERKYPLGRPFVASRFCCDQICQDQCLICKRIVTWDILFADNCKLIEIKTKWTEKIQTCLNLECLRTLEDHIIKLMKFNIRNCPACLNFIYCPLDCVCASDFKQTCTRCKSCFYWKTGELANSDYTQYWLNYEGLSSPLKKLINLKLKTDGYFFPKTYETFYQICMVKRAFDDFLQPALFDKLDKEYKTLLEIGATPESPIDEWQQMNSIKRINFFVSNEYFEKVTSVALKNFFLRLAQYGLRLDAARALVPDFGSQFINYAYESCQPLSDSQVDLLVLNNDLDAYLRDFLIKKILAA